MAEPDDSSTKDKPGWINGEDADLKPADETEDELEPAEESMLELKPAEVIVDELDELSELSDTSLELNELNLSSVHFKPILIKNAKRESARKSWSLSPSKQPLIRWTCASYQATFRNPSFGGLVSHIKHQLKSGSIIGPSATHCVTKNKQYIQEPATVEKYQELSKQLLYTRLASVSLMLWDFVHTIGKVLIIR
ncbi:hypothetical protein YC2023_099599 [Brassica napus]